MEQPIQYAILTPSQMEVIYNGKKLHISGEITTTPAFYADISSIKYWEPPNEKDEVSNEEKEEIIKVISAKSMSRNIRVFFE